MLVGFVSYAAYHLAKSLKILQFILEDTKDFTHDIDSLKDTIKLGLFSLVKLIPSTKEVTKKWLTKK